jgi:hypothetical protein
MPHPHRLTLIALLLALLTLPVATPARAQSPRVALAYVHHDIVTLAGPDGTSIVQPGPTFAYGQGARLFWTANAQTLYIARSDALYATSAGGSPAVQVPGSYGRTLAMAQDGATLYYLETGAPAELEAPFEGMVGFPLRELPFDLLDGSTGRLSGYFGRYAADSAHASVTFAAALYARDGGLRGSGRPELWPTYGASVFGTCCFPEPGLGVFDVNLGEFSVYDETFVPGPAAMNLTGTHLAGPTTDPDTIRIYDLITSGWRDYTIQLAGGIGTIERIAWSPDDTYLYVVTRGPASAPLTLDHQPGTFTVDPSSADITLYRLNLVTGVIRELARRANVYGVSSLAATDQYVFAVVVDPNTLLVQDLNARRVRPGSVPDDPELAKYMPATHLWRVDVDGDEVMDIADDVWGVTARPIR